MAGRIGCIFRPLSSLSFFAQTSPVSGLFAKYRWLMFGCVLALTVGCGESKPTFEAIEFSSPLLDPGFSLEDFDAIVELGESERPAIEEAFKARNKDYTDWFEKRGDEVEKNQKKLAEAEASGDEALRDSYEVRLRPALEARRAVLVDHREAILEAMSDESADRWHAHVVSLKVEQLMEPLNLSAEQQGQITNWALESVQEFPRSTERLSGAFFSLEKRIEADALSEAQRETYLEIKRANPRRGMIW